MVDVVAQGVVNGDFSKVDVFDAALAGAGKPVFSAIMGSAIDIKPLNNDKKWSVVMYNKSVASTGVDFGIKLTFGGADKRGS
ncbi:hypothetical protein [uncultured Chitinophaga sp.]|jgi:hypothetical protein|uniref:hypothetical protein n=1 Tax=uncultured Chitinophaga sp. TaxID=339340 RepID=UPI002601F4C3|nr:hypothetical protein [uncultured Chitinophaga sp.]